MNFAKAQMAIMPDGKRRATGNWLYNSEALGYVSIPDADTVCDGCECPDCGEARVDWLAWDDDGTFVTCATCGCAYVPA